MSADGKWKITINTPMGARTVDADLVTEGDKFTGTADSDMGSQPVSGTINGDNLAWTLDITNPMPMKLEFDAKVDGDKMTGTVKLGMFGNAALTGERA
jgi:hypothetical protein